ncbi:MAG: peptidylprolyl isomerase [Paludibacteraceae bacterium]|nr:peptidylprolyl isomerase [Candidatus Colousia faecequi]MCQ2337830.1 peptidylprolyl isomerase [Paludibacteraceae bacterium]
MRTSAITILLILLSTVAYPQTVDTVATTEKRLEERKMIDGVVWVVGDEAILRSEVEQERMRAEYEGTHIPGEPYCLIPEQIAIQKLFIHQAKIDSIEVNNGQVDMQVNAQISYFLREVGSKEKLEEYMKKPLDEIKSEMRRSLADQSLVQQVQYSLTEDVNVTPSEVKRYYNNLSEDSIPMVAAQVEVEIITVEPPIPKEAIEDVKRRLREFADRVNSGQVDFSVLARLYSDDEATAKRGGELGFMGRGALVPEFADAAFALSEPGKVSRIVETEFGYHIIQLIERRDDRVNCRHILLRPRASTEDKVSAVSHLDSLAKDIRMGKITFGQAAEMFSSDKDTRMNGGLMMNAEDGSSRFEYQQLPTEIARQVTNMKEGEISEAFPMFSEKLNHEVYVIVRLKHKLQNHKANLTEDYQMLRKMCENETKQKIIEAWLRNKIKETYVFISPEWRDCEYHYPEWKK